MIKNKKKKNLKPIDADIHFKYRCPGCSTDHWISLSESKTKNFKIVCYCSSVIKPKRIDGIEINYHKTKKSKRSINVSQGYVEDPQTIKETETKIEIETETIDKKILDKCVEAIIKYGFTKEESIGLVEKAYKTNPSTDCIELIKQALKSLGATNE